MKERARGMQGRIDEMNVEVLFKCIPQVMGSTGQAGRADRNRWIDKTDGK